MQLKIWLFWSKTCFLVQSQTTTLTSFGNNVPLEHCCIAKIASVCLYFLGLKLHICSCNMYINSTLYDTNIMEHCLTIIRVISPLSFSGQLALINWSTQWQKVSFAKGIVAFLGVTQWLKSPQSNLNLSQGLKISIVLFSVLS